MALREVVKLGEPLLRETSRPVTIFDERLGMLLDDMRDTMIKEIGVGLAAPQIGILKRICVVLDEDDNIIELINPLIVKREGKQTSIEGCLSIPNKSGEVVRSNVVVVEAQDRHGKQFSITASERLAIIFQHEIDHLDGVLFIDRLGDKSWV